MALQVGVDLGGKYRGYKLRPPREAQVPSPPTPPPTPVRREILGCGLFLVAAILIELVIAWFVKGKGVSLTGDEPAYIIQAQAYLHLTFHILPTIRTDLARHALSSYGVGAPVSAVESFTGPRGMIGAFEPGMGLLLAPFVATGRIVFGAVVGMLTLQTAGLILLHRRATRLVSLSRRGQLLLGLVLAGPAMLVAINQIYPDLISGIVLACAIIEVALVERTSTVTKTNAIILVTAVALLPWLQVKNIVPAVFILAAFVVVALRSSGAWRRVAAAAAPAVVAWGALLLYNHLYFGHLDGLPEPFPKLSLNGIEYTLGLLFDRHQGMFIQVPFALIGLVGLWISARRLPAAVLASVASVGAILVLNGTYTVNPYGGLSLAGRFMWTLLPVMVVWIAPVIVRWEEVKRLLWIPFLVVTAAWIYQAVPILSGDHTYFNAFSFTPLWDPASWPGWWPGFNRLLPQFDLPGHPLGAPAVSILLVLALGAALVIAAVQYMRSDAFARWSLGVMGLVALLLIVALATIEPLHPTTALAYDASQLGTPVVGGASGQVSPEVPLQGVSSGTYRFVLNYSVTGAATPTSMTVSCINPSGAAMLSDNTPLRPNQSTATATIHCPQAGVVASQLSAGPGQVLHVASLRLRWVGP